MCPGDEVQYDVTCVVRETDLLDDLTAQYVTEKTRPRGVLGDFKVVQGHIALGELCFEHVNEGRWKGRGDHVKTDRQ